MTQAWRRMYFTDAVPSPSPGAHRITLTFDADGGISFDPATDDPHRLAALALPLFEAMSVRPELVLEAAGVHGAAAEWPEDDDQEESRE